MAANFLEIGQGFDQQEVIEINTRQKSIGTGHLKTMRQGTKSKQGREVIRLRY